MNRIINYKGFSIEKCLTGWYSVFTKEGFKKSNTLSGIKAKINDLIKSTK